MRIFKFGFKLNTRGLSLVEVLVSAAMTAIISLGIATMMQNSFKEQRRILILDTLKNQKSKFESMFRDQTVWNKTVYYNAVTAPKTPFTTLYASMNGSASKTTAVAYTSPSEFQLAFADGSLAYDLLGPSDTSGPYNGFNEKGGYTNDCKSTGTGFNADPNNGNDTCPFSYRLLIGATCPSGESSCANPQLKLVARLVFNPATTGVLRSYASIINAVAGVDISDSALEGKWDAVVKRTATGVNRSFRLAVLHTPSTSGCNSNTQGGACTRIANYVVNSTSGIHPRVVSSSWQVMYDPYQIVSGTGTPPYNLGTSFFQLKEAGFYGCILTAPGFAADNLTISFAAVNSSSQYQSTIAETKINVGRWSQGTAVVDTKFSINTPDTSRYSVYQKCTAADSGSSWDGCTLGWMADYYSSQEFISLNCYKMDRAM